ncbi:MAG: YdcH family protein [Sphingorhabdus sp.]
MNNSHMTALRMKHAELEEKLDREERRPLPDTNLIHALKKQKLQLKDVIMQESLPA